MTVSWPRGRLAGEYRLLCQAAGGAEAGSDGWCTVQLWLGRAAQFRSGPAGALGHFTAVRDAVAGQPPSRALTAALTGRAAALRLMGRTAEAAGDARRALALAPADRGPGQGAAGPWPTSASTPTMPAITTRRSGWPGRPGISRPGSPADSPDCAAMC